MRCYNDFDYVGAGGQKWMKVWVSEFGKFEETEVWGRFNGARNNEAKPRQIREESVGAHKDIHNAFSSIYMMLYSHMNV